MSDSAIQHELRVSSADDFQIAGNLPSTEGNECFQHRQDYLLCRHFEGLRPSGIFKEALLGRLRVRGKGLRPS
jgi:hypothetical protein